MPAVHAAGMTEHAERYGQTQEMDLADALGSWRELIKSGCVPVAFTAVVRLEKSAI
jgi:hypothetical protein